MALAEPLVHGRALDWLWTEPPCTGTLAAGGTAGGPSVSLVLARRRRRRHLSLGMATGREAEMAPSHGAVGTGEVVTSTARRAASRYDNRAVECTVGIGVVGILHPT